ncbi:hypothetical protein D1872_262770 [compost metagenome]
MGKVVLEKCQGKGCFRKVGAMARRFLRVFLLCVYGAFHRDRPSNERYGRSNDRGFCGHDPDRDDSQGQCDADRRQSIGHLRKRFVYQRTDPIYASVGEETEGSHGFTGAIARTS